MLQIYIFGELNMLILLKGYNVKYTKASQEEV
jgi:hypothetical protein